MAKTYDEIKDQVRKSEAAGVFTAKRLSLFIVGIVGVVALTLSGMLFETNDAGYYKILQKPVTGTMQAFTSPGMFWQGFGDVFTYKASENLYFSKHENEGREADDSIEVRYNDGATAHVTGNIRIDLPSDPDKLIEIHKKFRSYDSLIRDTVKQAVGEAAILTAALMTAEDSYTTKRAEFSQMMDDQLKNGVYLTESEIVQVNDPKTGQTVNKSVVRIQRDKSGKPMRKESVLASYGIRVSQAIVKEIDYEKTVADQISAKQAALMQVVSAKANAEKAIQDRLTAEDVGRKNVAVAQYEQEVEKKRAIVTAEKELEVAKLGRLAAEQNKAAKIAQAEGEGEYRRKVMLADGALQQKLDAYVKVQSAWAEALAKSQNRLVPEVVMGGNGAAGAQNAAMTFMDILGAKAAKDLSLEIGGKKQ